MAWEHPAPAKMLERTAMLADRSTTTTRDLALLPHDRRETDAEGAMPTSMGAAEKVLLEKALTVSGGGLPQGSESGCALCGKRRAVRHWMTRDVIVIAAYRTPSHTLKETDPSKRTGPSAQG